MLRLALSQSGKTPFDLLCLGAHADDIEIGCGATILRLVREIPALRVLWIVFSGIGERESEAHRSAALFLQGCNHTVEVLKFRDGFFPSQSADIKDHFETLKGRFDPSLVLTHWRGDAHQDHRTVSELTHNTFRNHLIWEYEIPKYDGDLANPNLFVPLTRPDLQRKAKIIIDSFASQRTRNWFTEETFGALARIRGIGCNAPDGVAEAFYAGKLVI